MRLKAKTTNRLLTVSLGNFIKPELAFYIASFALCSGFYLWLRQAPPDAPFFLLAPISQLSSVLSGVQFVFVPEIGFCGTSPSATAIIIEKSCSGGNFLIILFSLLVFTQLQRLPRFTGKMLVFAGILVFSCLSSIITSALRVAASILLLDISFEVSPVLVHNIIGILTYFTAICTCYLVAQRLVTILGSERKTV